MYLLAESGATKTDWIVFDESGIQKSFRTSGINPMVQSERQIRDGALTELKEVLEVQPEKLFFYGAGLRTPDKRELVSQMLAEVFPDIPLNIEHDLLGAARATCGDEPGITCILGTGSNSCWFDGEKITFEIGGNGYLLGDEGSGSDLGKTLVKRALDIELPAEIISEFEEWAGRSILQIRNDAYAHPRPNYYFAEFSKFIHAKLDKPTMRTLVISRFTEFLTRTVMRYAGYHDMPVHFVGSIAKFYQYELAEACGYMKLKPGRVVQAPAEALVHYHLDRLKAVT